LRELRKKKEENEEKELSKVMNASSKSVPRDVSAKNVS